ncbi:hypothetical protein MY11210_008934 [Beauveria gryllotalpidicola]
MQCIFWEKTGKGIGYGDWGRLSYNDPKGGLKVFLPSSPIVDFPFSKIPEHIVSCGPIVRSTAAIEEADPKLASMVTPAADRLYQSWNARGHIKSNIYKLLWKVNRGKTDEEADHTCLYKEAGVVADDERLLIMDWLLAEPTSLFKSGSTS